MQQNVNNSIPAAEWISQTKHRERFTNILYGNFHNTLTLRQFTNVSSTWCLQLAAAVGATSTINTYNKTDFQLKVEN